MRIPVFLAAALLLGSPDPVPGAAGTAEPEGTRETLARALASLEADGSLQVAGETLPYGKDLVAFYRRRGWEPAWSLHGYAGVQGWQLLDAIRAARQDGLEPSEYHEAALDSLLRLFWKKIFRRARVGQQAFSDLDILLSHAYLALAAHMLAGRHHPPALSDRWHAHDEGLDLPAHLESALASGRDVRDIVAALAPPYPEYRLLKAWLEDYRRQLAAGGWPDLPREPQPPGPGGSGSGWRRLCERLRMMGDFPAEACPDSLAGPVAEALRRFQARHGLAAPGRPDAATWSALAVPLEKRIGQLRRALEYWRWLPRDLGPRHVRVNIADFRLGAYEGAREVLSRRVVLGTLRDRTPVFSDRITALVVNPSWTVPASIAGEEILPQLRKDPRWLERHDMELLAEGSDAAAVPHPDSVDWSRVTAAAFPFRLRQRPGPDNPLGRIKFVLTNPLHVYLHDTPAADQFERGSRAFSHGCVRVERPLELAAWAVSDPRWTADSLAKEIGKGRERQIPVRPGGVPVHLLYWTAFADAGGVLQFRGDVYGWDRMLERMLAEAAAAPRLGARP